MLFMVSIVLYFIISFPSAEPNFESVTLTSNYSSSKIYIKSEIWGLAGGSRVTVISTDELEECKADTTKEYVFLDLEPFVYKAQNDTLFIYTRRKVPVPKKFKSKWTIKQLELGNPEMMDLKTNSTFKHP